MKSKDKNVCKICGRIIANPDNKTGICLTCSGNGKKIGGIFFGIIAGVTFLVKKFKR